MTSADDELTTADVVEFFAEKQGKPLSPHTWRSYGYRGHAPKPARYVGATPVWRRGDVEEWMRTRPGRPGQPRRDHDDA